MLEKNQTQVGVGCLTAAAVAWLVTLACSGPEGDERCTAGQVRGCTCLTGDPGTQTCAPSGLWEGCVCGGAITGGSGGGVAVAGGMGGGEPITGGSGGGELITGGMGGTGGGTAGTGGTVETATGDSGIIPADGSIFIADWNVSGVIGPWYTFQDDAGSTIAGTYPDPTGSGAFGSAGGELCFTGTAVGHQDLYYETNWGAAAGFDVCAFPDDTSWLPADLQAAASPEQVFMAADCPTLLSGVTSITFTISGSWSELRVNFKGTSEVAPFYGITGGGTYTLTVSYSDTLVPSDWDVPNAGEVSSTNIEAIHFQVVSQASTTSFDFCVSNITIN